MARGDHLSDFELYVMLAVAALDADGAHGAYGVTIAQRIEERTGRDVSIGAVYATLGRLADKDYVSFRISDPEPVRGGRARKLVSLTPAGTRALRRTTESLARMLDGTRLQPVIGLRR